MLSAEQCSAEDVHSMLNAQAKGLHCRDIEDAHCILCGVEDGMCTYTYMRVHHPLSTPSQRPLPLRGANDLFLCSGCMYVIYIYNLRKYGCIYYTCGCFCFVAVSVGRAGNLRNKKIKNEIVAVAG